MMDKKQHHRNQEANNKISPSLSNMKIPNSNSIRNSPNYFRLMNSLKSSQPSICFEIRLFYVRFSPCVIDILPGHLTLRHIRRELGVSLEINGSRVPTSEIACSTLRRDRVDKESSEVTYVSTDSVRITGGVEFEVYEDENKMILCGSLERLLEPNLRCNGFDNEEKKSKNNNENNDMRKKTGWSMDCYTTSSISNSSNGGCGGGVSSSAFCQPKLGVSSPSIEVYIAGCCSGIPVILTKTINVSPRRKVPRCATLDAIPEDEETGKEHEIGNGYFRQRKLQLPEAELDCYESDGKFGSGWHSEEMYAVEDGQLSWFNAGVRVGVGIGLGMCLGVGIGVGLLMRSYQATTRNFRRRFP